MPDAEKLYRRLRPVATASLHHEKKRKLFRCAALDLTHGIGIDTTTERRFPEAGIGLEPLVGDMRSGYGHGLYYRRSAPGMQGFLFPVVLYGSNSRRVFPCELHDKLMTNAHPQRISAILISRLDKERRLFYKQTSLSRRRPGSSVGRATD